MFYIVFIIVITIETVLKDNGSKNEKNISYVFKLLLFLIHIVL